MSKKKLAGIIVACIVVVIAVVIATTGDLTPPSEQPTPTPESKPPEVETPKAKVEIVDSSLEFHSLGFGSYGHYGYFRGEVENTGGWSATHVRITVEFYDHRGYLLGRGAETICSLSDCSDMGRYRDVPELRPGYKIAFEVGADLESRGYSTYTLEVTSFNSVLPSELYDGFEILDVKEKRVGYPGSIVLNVECHNAGREQQGTGLLATFYDSQGKIVGRDLDFVCLLPNQVKTLSLRCSFDWVDYSLWTVCTCPCE